MISWQRYQQNVYILSHCYTKAYKRFKETMHKTFTPWNFLQAISHEIQNHGNEDFHPYIKDWSGANKYFFFQGK